MMDVKKHQMLILMKGHPGVGKSSIAMCMATLLHVPLIDKDDARDSFSSLCQTAEVSACSHQDYLSPSRMHACKLGLSVPMQEDLNVLSYEIMWRYAEKQLQCGLDVVVDCPLARRELYMKGRQLVNQVSS